MSPFGSTIALSGSTTSPLALSWQSFPMSSYPAGHRGLSVDCAAAGTDKRLTVRIVRASLRILVLHVARESRIPRACRKAAQSGPEVSGFAQLSTRLRGDPQRPLLRQGLRPAAHSNLRVACI